jgi:hypothetical protein
MPTPDFTPLGGYSQKWRIRNDEDLCKSEDKRTHSFVSRQQKPRGRQQQTEKERETWWGCATRLLGILLALWHICFRGGCMSRPRRKSGGASSRGSAAGSLTNGSISVRRLCLQVVCVDKTHEHVTTVSLKSNCSRTPSPRSSLTRPAGLVKVPTRGFSFAAVASMSLYVVRCRSVWDYCKRVDSAWRWLCWVWRVRCHACLAIGRAHDPHIDMHVYRTCAI